jgi:hypothetical protein
MDNVPIFEVEEVNVHPPLEADTNAPADTVVGHIVPAVPVKKWQKANDSMSGLLLQNVSVAKDSPDQDALLA